MYGEKFDSAGKLGSFSLRLRRRKAVYLFQYAFQQIRCILISCYAWRDFIGIGDCRSEFNLKAIVAETAGVFVCKLWKFKVVCGDKARNG